MLPEGATAETKMTPTFTTTTTTTAKRALRTTIKKSLSQLPAELVISQSQTCLRTLLTLPEFTAASRLSVFLSMPGKEIDTAPIVEHSFRSGKQVFVPFIHRHPPRPYSPNTLAASVAKPPGMMDMVSLASLDDYHSLLPDSWGIPTIPGDSLSSRVDSITGSHNGLDIILMPGVAFDESFKRLGHGRGFYDYYLARYRKAREEERMPILIALAFKEQLLGRNEVPVDETDWLVDVIVTGDGRCLRREEQLN